MIETFELVIAIAAIYFIFSGIKERFRT